MHAPDELFPELTDAQLMSGAAAQHREAGSRLLEALRETISDQATGLNAQAAIIARLNARDPEAFRREQPSISTYPLRPEEVQQLDYSMAGNLIDRAKHHLDEGLPGGQRHRCELAMRQLRRGVEELAVWMRARGYDV
jgi:hypothetical protein